MSTENRPDQNPQSCPTDPSVAPQSPPRQAATNRPKTPADTAAHPDRADDLYDDSLPRNPPEQTPRVVESTARSTQADVRVNPHVPLDHHDPLSGRPSTHPVGTTVGAATGAAAGAAAGAAIGALIGPAGAALGAAAGAIAAGFAGGATGRVVAESIHPSTEDHYWQTHYRGRPYVAPNTPYDTYRPAYQFGIETRRQHCDKTWTEAEPMLQQTWELSANAKQMSWSKAAPAVRDAWDKLTPCDPDL